MMETRAMEMVVIQIVKPNLQVPFRNVEMVYKRVVKNVMMVFWTVMQRQMRAEVHVLAPRVGMV